MGVFASGYVYLRLLDEPRSPGYAFQTFAEILLALLARRVRKHPE